VVPVYSVVVPYRLCCQGLSVLTYRCGQLPGRASVVIGELQSAALCIYLCGILHTNVLLSSTHKVRKYKEYHSVCPRVGIGTLPPPLSPASVPLPPEPKGGGGAHSPAAKGLGEFQFRRLEKSLALCLLCGSTAILFHSRTVCP
jgi:hypothetical protein